MRIIKKYSNRRLYDCEQSEYITLDTLKDFVLAQIPFKVVDHETEEDKTVTALLNILTELEAKGGTPIFNEALLRQLIALYAHPGREQLGAWMAPFLHQCFAANGQESPPDLWRRWLEQTQHFWAPWFSPSREHSKRAPQSANIHEETSDAL